MKWKQFFLVVGVTLTVTAATTLTSGQTPAAPSSQPAQTAPAAQESKVALLCCLALRGGLRELATLVPPVRVGDIVLVLYEVSRFLGRFLRTIHVAH